MLNASAFEISLLVLADLVPSCVVGLPVGVWVDRVRRLPLMIASDVMRAAVLVSIPIAAAFDALTLAQLYAVSFVASALTVLFNVAQVSILPALVSREDLLEANSKTSATQSISEIGAFGIGGWLVQLARLSGVLVAGVAGEIIGLRATLGLGGAVVTLAAIFLVFTSLPSLKTMPNCATHAADCRPDPRP
jgi:MFS family permease